MKCLTNNDLIFDKYTNSFSEQDYVILPSILDTSVIDFLQKSFEQSFEKRMILSERSSEYSVSNPIVNIKLDVIFNAPDFLNSMSQIIGKKINFTRQRLYYIDESCISLPWHDDSHDKDTRVAALRFELSDTDYEGGEFYYKNKSISHKFENLKFGESVLFKIDYNNSFHMIGPMLKGRRKSLIIFLCV